MGACSSSGATDGQPSAMGGERRQESAPEIAGVGVRVQCKCLIAWGAAGEQPAYAAGRARWGRARRQRPHNELGAIKMTRTRDKSHHAGETVRGVPFGCTAREVKKRQGQGPHTKGPWKKRLMRRKRRLPNEFAQRNGTKGDGGDSRELSGDERSACMLRGRRIFSCSGAAGVGRGKHGGRR